jgi:hypothetical protein
MIGIFRDLGATLVKMFAADLWLTLVAIASVALSAGALRTGLIGASVLPFVLAGGILAALVVGVIHGARR